MGVMPAIPHKFLKAPGCFVFNRFPVFKSLFQRDESSSTAKGDGACTDSSCRTDKSVRSALAGRPLRRAEPRRHRNSILPGRHLIFSLDIKRSGTMRTETAAELDTAMHWRDIYAIEHRPWLWEILTGRKKARSAPESAI